MTREHRRAAAGRAAAPRRRRPSAASTSVDRWLQAKRRRQQVVPPAFGMPFHSARPQLGEDRGRAQRRMAGAPARRGRRPRRRQGRRARRCRSRVRRPPARRRTARPPRSRTALQRRRVCVLGRALGAAAQAPGRGCIGRAAAQPGRDRDPLLQREADEVRPGRRCPASRPRQARFSSPSGSVSLVPPSTRSPEQPGRSSSRSASSSSTSSRLEQVEAVRVAARPPAATGSAWPAPRGAAASSPHAAGSGREQRRSQAGPPLDR